MFSKLSSDAAVFLALGAALVIVAARAAEPEPALPAACDKAALSELDYLVCEGGSLRSRSEGLTRTARAQLAEGRKMAADCEQIKEVQEANSCNLISSDLEIDAAFKLEEAADLRDQADRMEARAQDLRKAKP